jgi:hypothetical protein
MSAWYAFYQRVGGNEDWNLMLAEARDKVVAEVRPQFVTILDVDHNFKEEPDAEALAKLRYRGPFYVDFDSPDIEEAIEQFQKFLLRLRDEQGFDLEQAQLFASGGKGFHCIIPTKCFMAKENPRGIVGLPHIYKYMAASEELYVDTLDLRVYTARRGRQFRVENVERLNKEDKPTGRYKVPITVAEALSMDKALYDKLVSMPRHVPAPKPPELNHNLAVLYQSGFDELEGALKAKKKSKVDERLLKRFKGEIPPSIQTLLSGENAAEGVGFQKIATQIALTMHALAIPEDRMLNMCAGLIKNHVSDGNRYNTPAKRRNELQRMYRYMDGNPSYTFSVGGIKSVIDRAYETPDLDSGGVEIEEEEAAEQQLDAALLQGLRVTTTGIFRNTDDGLVPICSMGMANPRMLIDIKSEDVVGYEVDIYVDGKKKSSKMLTMDTFRSRASFLNFTLSAAGANVSATDFQTGAIADILRARAEQKGDKVYTVQAEGLDVVVRPDSELDVVWADRYGVRSASGQAYKLVGGLTSEVEYNTDIALAPELTNTPENLEFFVNLFNVNSPQVMAKMLGWYVACWFSQIIRYKFNQFPLMQCVGQAGSGKSKTNELLMRMHYFRSPPRLNAASSMTPFVMDSLAAGSASIPFFIDEYKPRQMRKDRLDKLDAILRENFTQLGSSRGRVANESGASKLGTKAARNAAPITIVTEAAILQSAIMERTVYVNFSKESKRGHKDAYNHCLLNSEVLSMFGRTCLEAALNIKVNALGKMVLANGVKIEERVGDLSEDAARPVFCGSVVLTGLEIMQMILKKVFGEKAFEAEFERMRSVLLDSPDELVPRQKSELGKVFDSLAYMSQLPEHLDDPVKLNEGMDYYVTGDTVEFKMRACWDKYVQYTVRVRGEQLFDSFEAFLHGCAASGGVLDKHSPTSGLKDSPSTVVYTLDKPWLAKEGVSEFRE